MTIIKKQILRRLLSIFSMRQNNTRCWSDDLVTKLKKEAESGSLLNSFQNYIKNRTNGWNAYKIRWETTPANKRNEDRVLMDIKELNFIDDYVTAYSGKTSDQIIKEITDKGGYDAWKKQFKDNASTETFSEFLDKIEGWNADQKKQYKDFFDQNDKIAKLFEAADDAEKTHLANTWKKLSEYKKLKNKSYVL
jgi:ribosomal protein L14E/L6E/L27E